MSFEVEFPSAPDVDARSVPVGPDSSLVEDDSTGVPADQDYEFTFDPVSEWLRILAIQVDIDATGSPSDPTLRVEITGPPLLRLGGLTGQGSAREIFVAGDPSPGSLLRNSATIDLLTGSEFDARPIVFKYNGNGANADTVRFRTTILWTGQ